jgi:DNA-directed RNA polymerase subunit RPC12/RpoP
MNVSYTCPKCDRGAKVELPAHPAEVACPHCGFTITPPEGGMAEGGVAEGRVHRCLVCPNTELFVRKDFNQRLGLACLFVGLGASCVTWYLHLPYLTFGILGGTALIDALLYLLVGNLLQCYRCQAEYRGVAGLERHEPFDLEVHERHRQQLARLGKPTVRNAAAGNGN